MALNGDCLRMKEQILELLVMVYSDDLKEGVTRLICRLKIRVAFFL